MWQVLKKSIFGLVLVALGYLLFWPVPVDPVVWNPPVNKGYVGDYAPNKRLVGAELLSIGDEHGPEDVAIGADGSIYAAVTAGKIIKIEAESGRVSDFVVTGGRPLGIEFDRAGNLLVADSIIGLLRISPDGKQEVLIDNDGQGRPLVYTNDVDSDDRGVIYFTESSSKFGAMASGGTLEGSLLEIMEHGGNGRVFRFDPKSGKIETIMDGLTFANGIAVDKNGEFVLVAETGSYRIHKIWIKGDKAGQSEVLIENLPGFPDNINHGLNSTFWVGIVSKRSALLDKILDKPWLRKIVQRLPSAVRPKAQPYGLVVRFNGDGKIIETLQDASASYVLTTGAVEAEDGTLYVTSLIENRLARVKSK